jgi:hypothetical protein
VFNRIGRAAALGAVLTLLVGIGAVSAHEHREVGEYSIEVGFLEEPVYTGDKSGLELFVAHHESEEPVEGLEETLSAEVTFGDETRELEISAVFGEPGAYRSLFFPTAAGSYTFHITGDIEGTAIDESFTSGPDTFGDIRDATAGQFPVAYPPTADIVRDAEAGAAASTTATVALVLGGAGLVAGLVALGMSVARRRA